MNATRMLHDLGQSLWLDNITRDPLRTGPLKRYIGELSVTGLTSNPTIFDQAIKNSTGTKDPKASDVLYIEAFAIPFTANTMLMQAMASKTEALKEAA